MRKILNSFESIGVPTITNLESFPYDQLVEAPSGNLFLVRFVDPVNGDDSNDGRLLSSAFNSITAAVNSLPSDLKKYTVQIFILPGTYEATEIRTCYNGNISIQCINSSYDLPDGLTDHYAIYNSLKGNSSYTATDDPIIFKDTNKLNDRTLFIDGLAKDSAFNLTVSFENAVQQNYWDDENHYLYEGIQFVGNTVDNALTRLINFAGGCSVNFNSHIKFDLGNTTLAGIESGWMTNVNPNHYIRIKYFSAIGGTGDASVSTGGFRGLFLGHRNNWVFEAVPRGTGAGGVGTFKGAADFASSKSVSINGIENLCYIWDENDNSYFDWQIADSQIEILNGSLGHTPAMNVYLVNGEGRFSFAGDMTVFTDKITLADWSQYYYKDTNSGAISKKSAEGIELVEGNSTITATDTATTDASLQNSQVSFSLDETGDNLAIKVKYSDGTVKTATVALA